MDNTLFFGNSLNRLTEKNISWDELLNKLKDIRKFENGNLPNTMIYERIMLERPDVEEDVLHDEYNVKETISELMNNIEPHDVYFKLFNSNFQNYITTNYDYAFIDSIIDKQIINLPIIEHSTEDVYSIRRLKEIKNTLEKKKNFWQIHGEIRKPASIMLGLDHYCGSIGKIDSYIKGWYNYIVDGEKIVQPSIEEKFKTNSFNNSSWVELFFISNIHIVGFSLDYSEIDLWWIINKRARLKKSQNLRNLIKNKIIFYCNEIDEHKKGVLESMDIEVKIIKLSNKKSKYLDYYSNLIEEFDKKK